MVSVNSWQSWGQPWVPVLAEAPKGIRVVVWFGSGTELAAGRHGSAKALQRAPSLSALAAAPSSHPLHGTLTHLLLYVKLRTWVISPNAGSCILKSLYWWSDTCWMGYVFRCGQGNLSPALVFMKTFQSPIWVIMEIHSAPIEKRAFKDPSNTNTSLEHDRWHIQTQFCSKTEQ